MPTSHHSKAVMNEPTTAPETAAPDLQPCPSCGARHEILEFSTPEDYGCYFVRCLCNTGNKNSAASAVAEKTSTETKSR